MQTAAGLDAGLLVGRAPEFIRRQILALPLALVEIQNPSGFRGEIRIAGEDPAARLPGPDGILVDPSARASSR